MYILRLFRHYTGLFDCNISYFVFKIIIFLLNKFDITVYFHSIKRKHLNYALILIFFFLNFLCVCLIKIYISGSKHNI